MKNLKTFIQTFFFIIMSTNCSLIFALDNPESADFISEFKTRAKPYEQAIDSPGLTNPALISANYNYQLFLDKELNKAYKRVMSNLAKKQKQELKNSQKIWIKFRDAEFEFIQNNWTRDNFGSSIYGSRGDYRSEIIKNRVLQLLYYALNY